MVLAFLDDIMVLGKTFREHLKHLREVFQRLRTYILKLKPKKCAFFRTKIDFLGRTVSVGELQMGEGSITVNLNWPKPKNTKDVERFLGLANYHRSFIKSFGHISVPLYQLT